MATLPTEIVVPDINIASLTEKDIQGNGVFDQLMATVNTQILEQFSAERITADNYGEVYLGALQTVMAQSVQFLLQKDAAAYQAALVLAQIKKTEQDILLTQEQIALIALQGNKLIADTAIATAQKLEIDEQIILLVSQQNKTNKEIDLYTQQILNAIEVVNKTLAETDLLGQKKTTEEGQTVTPTGGILKAQYDLYGAQTEGFKDDTIRKGVKAANDVFAIAKSNDPEAVSDPTNMLSVLEYFLNTLKTKQEGVTPVLPPTVNITYLPANAETNLLMAFNANAVNATNAASIVWSATGLTLDATTGYSVTATPTATGAATVTATVTGYSGVTSQTVSFNIYTPI